MKNILALVILVFLVFSGHSLQALELKEKCSIEFVTASKAQEILQIQDDFIKALSQFDKAARMTTSRVVDEEEFLNFISSHTLNWEPEEQQKIHSTLIKINKKLTSYNVYLPKKLYFIKTTGMEEGKAPYTRNGNAIILPEVKLNVSHQQLFETVSHEIFHIISHNNPRLRSELYALIGFKKCNSISLPKKWQDRKITNPDAPKNTHYIKITVNGKQSAVVPFLLSSEQLYNEKLGGNFFDYVKLKFLPIQLTKGEWQPILNDGRLESLNINEISGYFEQVGMNTHYIIHPEEILADNFTLLLTEKKKVLSPDLLKKLDKALSNH
jgi:hypothetical protein